MQIDLSKIIEYINTYNYVKAEKELKELLDKAPFSFELNKIMGVAQLGQRKYLKSLESFKNCLKKKTDDYQVNLNLSFIYLKIQMHEESIKFCHKAIENDKNQVSAYQNLTENYLLLGQYEEAESYANKAFEILGGIRSEKIQYYRELAINYCDVLLAKNDKDRLVNFILGLLDEGIYISDLLKVLIREDIAFIKENYIKTINQKIAELMKVQNKIARNSGLASCYFLLAEYYEKNKQNNYENFYFLANKHTSEIQRNSAFDRQKFYKWLIEKNDEMTLMSYEPQHQENDFIFICGMPRSGTTLVESILSTSDDICNGGEKVFFDLYINDFFGNFRTNKIDQNYINFLSENYLKSAHFHKKNSHQIFTDKMPANILYLAFIKKCFPNSRFIHCVRDPWENAISLFKHNYLNNLNYTSSFFRIATEYANYENLVSIWKKSDKNNQILDISYQDLITNTGEVVSNIQSFLKIQKPFDLTKRKNYFSRTASKQQVSKEIYRSSLSRRDFSDQKQNFLKDLEMQRGYWKNLS